MAPSTLAQSAISSNSVVVIDVDTNKEIYVAVALPSTAAGWANSDSHRLPTYLTPNTLGIGKIDGPEGLPIYTSIRGVAAE
jgi:hypothetical protein